MEIKEIEKEMMNAIQYADMDEDDFWATSTISPQEAKNLADAWSIIFSLRIKSTKKKKEFSKRFLLKKELEKLEECSCMACTLCEHRSNLERLSDANYTTDESEAKK